MDNQHKKITGYWDLSQAEIDLMNEIKAKEREVADLFRRIGDVHDNIVFHNGEGTRQLSIARTEFESAFMRMVRAVARPETPWVLAA